MTDPQHKGGWTPGERWGVQNMGGSVWVGELRPEPRVGFDALICSLEFDGLTKAAQRRNVERARLIAAAPELYEALENLLAVIRGDGGTKPDAIGMCERALAKASPDKSGVLEMDGKIQSELEFIRGIATNLKGDIDKMEAAFSKSQRTRTTERTMTEVRQRADLLIQCAVDALEALTPSTHQTGDPG